jgi:4-hydroxybenzoate polyprenyltransferase
MKRFLALSRTTHGLLDIAMPGFVALLWLGRFPDWPIVLLSLLTAFAGYTAIYALNDLVGVRVDRQKVAGAGINPGYAVEASALRYPLAQNLLSLRHGVAWFAGWYALTLFGAYLLNPLLVILVLAAAMLEAAYCLLLKVSCWRTVIGGLVKSCGPLAAVFVVSPNPPLAPLLLLLAWLMLWEIGGQNIPADWNDIEEDRRVGARTIPLSIGLPAAARLVLVTLTLVVLASLFLPLMSALRLGLPYLLASATAGFVLLLWPAWQLYRGRQSRQAARLFDRASYYPLAQLALITVFVLL